MLDTDTQEQVNAQIDAFAAWMQELGRQLSEVLQPFFERMISFVEQVRREMLFRALPAWMPTEWREWIRDHWPRRLLPRIGGPLWRRMIDGEQDG